MTREQEWQQAHEMWLRDPTLEHEQGLNRAADLLRRERRATYESEGVTDALLRERFEDDEDDEP